MMPGIDRAFNYITPLTRAKLVREPENSYAANAICVQYPFECDSKIGYIPFSIAEEWAPALDSGAFYIGWIDSVSKEKQRIKINVYEKPSFPLDDIAELSFEQSGFVSGHLSVKISSSSRQFIYLKESSPWSGEFRKTTLYFSEKQWRELLLPGLEKCRFPSWYDDYWNNGICDGLQWTMQIKYSSGETRSIAGSNDFPDEWELWHDLVGSLLDRSDLNKTEETEIRRKY